MNISSSSFAGFFLSLCLHVIFVMVMVFGLPFLRDKDPFPAPLPITIDLIAAPHFSSSTSVPGKTVEAPPSKQNKIKETSEKSVPEVRPKEVEALNAQPSIQKAQKAVSPRDQNLKKKGGGDASPSKKPPKKSVKKAKETKGQSITELIRQKATPPPNKGSASKDKKDPIASLIKEGASQKDASSPDLRLTMSEKTFISQRFIPCWKIPAALEKNKKFEVFIELKMNLDGTVKESRILDDRGSINHPRFQLAAESALRAVRDPLCSPLTLPQKKYQEWETILIRFSPDD